MNKRTLYEIKNYCRSVYIKTKGSQHGYDHAERVAHNAIWIVKSLSFESKLDRNLLLASCYLHDIIITQRDDKNYFIQLFNHIFERKLNKKFIQDITSQFSVPANERQILDRSIINHPYSIPFRCLNEQNDLYSKILQDADSIDYCSKARELSFTKKSGVLLVLLAKIYLSYIRNHIGNYLNFPRLKSFNINF